MNPEIFHWIGDILILIVIPFIGKLIWKVSEMSNDIKWLIRTSHAQSETNFLGSHSPTDHFGLDFYVDKYKELHGDLPFKDWIVIRDISQKDVEDKNKSMEDRSRARMNFEFACHKLTNCPNLSFVK